MEYRQLGKSGLSLSVFSFGSWVTYKNQIDDSLSRDMLKLAYDAGINFFDNAEVYAEGASEEIMGRSLKQLGLRRDSYCVSSKVFWGGPLPTQRGLSRKHVFDACHAAMERLQVDYLDLFYCHRPDLRTPIEETVRAMSDLVSQGKVMYWGTSEWSACDIAEAIGTARALGLVPPCVEQPQYNMFFRDKVEREFAPLYARHGLGTTTWSPLAYGVLTGKYANGVPEGSRMTLPGFEWLRRRVETPEWQNNVQKTQKLLPIAQSLGINLTHLSLAWCAKNPHVSSVILGASSTTQLQENLQAIDALPLLTPEVLAAIDEVLQNKPKPEPDHRAS